MYNQFDKKHLTESQVKLQGSVMGLLGNEKFIFEDKSYFSADAVGGNEITLYAQWRKNEE